MIAELGGGADRCPSLEMLLVIAALACVDGALALLAFSQVWSIVRLLVFVFGCPGELYLFRGLGRVAVRGIVGIAISAVRADS